MKLLISGFKLRCWGSRTTFWSNKESALKASCHLLVLQRIKPGSTYKVSDCHVSCPFNAPIVIASDKMRSVEDEVIHAQLPLQHIYNCQSVRHISAQRWEMCIANINFLMICVAEGSSLVKQAKFLITLYNYQLSRQEKKWENILWPAFRVAVSSINGFSSQRGSFFLKGPEIHVLNDTSKNSRFCYVE